MAASEVLAAGVDEEACAISMHASAEIADDANQLVV